MKNTDLGRGVNDSRRGCSPCSDLSPRPTRVGEGGEGPPTLHSCVPGHLGRGGVPEGTSRGWGSQTPDRVKVPSGKTGRTVTGPHRRSRLAPEVGTDGRTVGKTPRSHVCLVYAHLGSESSSHRTWETSPVVKTKKTLH